ncbi:hypothetical protein BH11VER1_BH11VER1_22980 [soil metagenome]
MSIPKKIHTMNTKDTLTPLELANLSAALVQACIVERKATPLMTAAVALAYWKTCADAIAKQSQADALDAVHTKKYKEKHKRLDNLLAEFANVEAVPVGKIITCCQAQNCKPSAAELKEISELHPWATLSKEKRSACVFLMLTNKPRTTENSTYYQGRTSMGSSYRPVILMNKRREWLKTGVPTRKVQLVIEQIWMAIEQRQAEKGREGADKKRRKPRAT